jgi:flagellar basal-body rod protein FlgF
LQNVNGAQVLDAGGAPIQLNPDGGEPAISGDGMITQGGRQTGAIGLFALDSAANLVRAGSSGFTSDIPGTAVLDFTTNGVVQGAVEGSNVNPIEEMTKLIAVTRNFDQVANEVNKSESSVEDAIKALGSSA